MPEDIARMVLFLTLDDGAIGTAQELTVMQDGLGLSCCAGVANLPS